MRALSHDEIVDAFKDLSDRLGRKRVKAHIYIVGGAAIALAFRRSRRTFDVDALILEGHGAVLEASREVARQRGWPDSWLNEQATTYLPLNPDQRAKTVFASSHLVVTGASPEHLLAMKLRSGRQADLTDIATLVDVLQLSTAEEVFGIHDAVFPSQPIGEEQRRAIEFFLQSHRKT